MPNKPRILLIDDLPENIKILGTTLGNKNFDISLATNGKQAGQLINQYPPDLILLDVNLPDIDGYKLCGELKERLGDTVPILFLTSRNDPNDIIRGFDAGGIDYITKPFYAGEVLARVNAHIRIRELVGNLEKEIEQRKQTEIRLRKLNEDLKIASTTDPLTGLFNRREILDKLAYEQRRFKRSRKVFSLMMIDIDWFKKINDQYGHAAGDQVLIQLAEIFRDTLRHQDLPCRWGGEEFLLLLPETNEEGCRKLAEKLQSCIRHTEFAWEQTPIPVTVSMGTTTYFEEMDLDDFVKIADERLYRAKEEGRNRIIGEEGNRTSSEDRQN